MLVLPDTSTQLTLSMLFTDCKRMLRTGGSLRVKDEDQGGGDDRQVDVQGRR